MIRDIFAERKRSLFMPFLMAGHPTPEGTIAAILALIAGGANLIELGVPFSDPVADGSVNQRAAESALAQGMSLLKTLKIVREIRRLGCHTPIVLMTYVNLIFALGRDLFVEQALGAGVDGVLIVDLPAEEEIFYQQLKAAGLDIVLLASPTTDPERFPLFKKLDPAFIYYISRLGVTGMQQDLASTLESEVRQLRVRLPEIPIAVGFGISSPAQAGTVAGFADGVIVGSLMVKTLGDSGVEGLRKLTREIVQVL